MKHLQKIKEVTVRVYQRSNGGFCGNHKFNCALDAKRFCEKASAESNKSLYFVICDKQNLLYEGYGVKI